MASLGNCTREGEQVSGLQVFAELGSSAGGQRYCNIGSGLCCRGTSFSDYCNPVKELEQGKSQLVLV